MDEMVKGIGASQHKCDYQVGMVEAFRGLLVEGDVEERAMLKKFVAAKKAWLATIKRSNKCKQQLATLGCQVGVMQCGGEEPTIKPFSICYNANSNFEIKGQTITISNCSFYCQGFNPT